VPALPRLEDADPDWEGRLEGIDDLDPPPPDGEGRLGALRPPDRPAEPPDDPDEPPEEPPEEDGEEVGEGIEVEEDCPAQPPIRNADTVPMAVTYAAPASSRFNDRRFCMTTPRPRISLPRSRLLQSRRLRSALSSRGSARGWCRWNCATPELNAG
jgi:hypothetical protein